MKNFSGKIIKATSEPVNFAPVVVEIETDEGEIEVVYFQRNYWNEFVEANIERINEPGFRVEFEGDPLAGGVLMVEGE